MYLLEDDWITLPWKLLIRFRSFGSSRLAALYPSKEIRLLSAGSDVGSVLQLLSRAICGAVKSTSFLPIHFYSLAISCFSSSTSKSSLFNCSKCQAVAYCSADHQVNMGKKNKGRRRQVKSETQKKAKGGPLGIIPIHYSRLRTGRSTARVAIC